MTPHNNAPEPFYLPEALWQQMLAHVLSCLPEEACGLVGSAQSVSPATAGPVPQGVTAAVILPIENELHSPVRFKMAPAEQIKAFYWFDEHQLELAAIFHSHPLGPDRPSPTDLAEFAYPGVLMLIISPLFPTSTPVKTAQDVAGWQVRAFRIDGGMATGLTAGEVPLVRVPESQRGLS